MKNRLNPDERQQLIQIARDSIVAVVTSGACQPIQSENENLCTPRGCFVTIKQKGALRGCIGNFMSDKPLCNLVQEMATSAATRDPRFYPMRSTDLPDFNVEISVLSTLQKITSIEEIEVGTHGIYLEKNHARGVLLPQVASEYGWDRETFLSQTCAKAGLKEDAWREGSDIYIFAAEVFGEAG
jgi:uncharacterized protein